MSAASDRRNARAQALGFTSYSQQYRATKAGYRSAQEYQGAVAANRGAVYRAQMANGDRVVAGPARSSIPGRTPPVAAALGRFSGDRLVKLTAETTDGEVIHLGDKGGVRMDWVMEQLADDGDWDDVFAPALDNYAGGVSGAIATVTARIA